jgi:uncharacterized phage protein gp47/JayE
MITIPKISTIRDQIITDIEARIGQTIPSMPKAFFRVLATALAGVISLLYRFAAWVYDQIFPQTASSEALVRIGEQYGIVRLPAVAAVQTATAPGTNTTIIPAGTLWQINGQVHRQTDAATISGGVATINLQALVAGDAGNSGIGAVLRIVTPQAGVAGTATITAVVTTGEDQEAIEDYRTRVLARLQQKPQGGAAADYIGWAREVAGVVKAFAFRTAPGDVTVYPLVSLTVDRIPDAPKLAEIEAYLQDEIRRPLCANVYTAAMTEREVNLTVTTLQPDTTTVRNTIQTALANYLLGRYPRQYTDEANPTDQIVRALLVSEAIAAGARVIEMDVYLDAEVVPTVFYQLDEDELAILGTITWPA